MMAFSEYIREVQKRLEISDPSELAERLSVPPRLIREIVQGKTVPKEELCLKIAFLAGEDPSTVLIIAKYTSAPTTAKPFWEKILLKMKDGSLYRPWVRDRRSWKDRRTLRFSEESSGGEGTFPDERRKRSDRRSWTDRRFPG